MARTLGLAPPLVGQAAERVGGAAQFTAGHGEGHRDGPLLVLQSAAKAGDDVDGRKLRLLAQDRREGGCEDRQRGIGLIAGGIIDGAIGIVARALTGIAQDGDGALDPGEGLRLAAGVGVVLLGGAAEGGVDLVERGVGGHAEILVEAHSPWLQTEP